jgi:hypothetical protein
MAYPIMKIVKQLKNNVLSLIPKNELNEILPYLSFYSRTKLLDSISVSTKYKYFSNFFEKELTTQQQTVFILSLLYSLRDKAETIFSFFKAELSYQKIMALPNGKEVIEYLFKENIIDDIDKELKHPFIFSLENPLFFKPDYLENNLNYLAEKQQSEKVLFLYQQITSNPLFSPERQKTLTSLFNSIVEFNAYQTIELEKQRNIALIDFYDKTTLSPAQIKEALSISFNISPYNTPSEINPKLLTYFSKQELLTMFLVRDNVLLVENLTLTSEELSLVIKSKNYYFNQQEINSLVNLISNNQTVGAQAAFDLLNSSKINAEAEIVLFDIIFKTEVKEKLFHHFMIKENNAKECLDYLKQNNIFIPISIINQYDKNRPRYFLQSYLNDERTKSHPEYHLISPFLLFHTEESKKFVLTLFDSLPAKESMIKDFLDEDMKSKIPKNILDSPVLEVIQFDLLNKITSSIPELVADKKTFEQIKNSPVIIENMKKLLTHYSIENNTLELPPMVKHIISMKNYSPEFLELLLLCHFNPLQPCFIKDTPNYSFQLNLNRNIIYQDIYSLKESKQFFIDYDTLQKTEKDATLFDDMIHIILELKQGLLNHEQALSIIKEKKDHYVNR